MTHSHWSEQIPLGKDTAYQSHYDASLLAPIPRVQAREQLPLDPQAPLPFHGVDRWTGYELSWLGPRGKPEVACAEFDIPCDSPAIIESKSFKLYLNSLNQTVFADWGSVQATLQRDLSAACGLPIGLTLYPVHSQALPVSTVDGVLLDQRDVACQHYQPAPQLLEGAVDPSRIVEERLVSHLLRSNCPVTGQPDWGSVVIDYRGPAIDHDALLAYIVSFREHQDFHEHCVERLYLDLMQYAQCERLTVYARYLRRGGLDINPLRSSQTSWETMPRLLRQ